MKLDLAKLPVGEMIVGFLLAVLAVTFVAAFQITDSGGKEQATASPTPGTSPTMGPTSTPGASPGGPVSVTMTDNKFQPDSLTVKAGATLTFDIKNTGVATHNLHIAGDGNKFNDSFCSSGGKEPCSDPNIVGPGQTAKLAWTALAAPGAVDFRCDFHFAQGMTGTITVQ